MRKQWLILFYDLRGSSDENQLQTINLALAISPDHHVDPGNPYRHHADPKSLEVQEERYAVL